MPKKYLKQILPSAPNIRKMTGVSWFSKWLGDDNLWHINRRSVSLGVAIGLFYGFWPVPVQTLLALVTAILIRANLPVSVVFVWISNPVTVVPIYGACYTLGAWLLGTHIRPISEHTFKAISQNIGALWVGCLILGAISAVFGWLLVRIFWSWRVRLSWSERKRRRKNLH
ncbi:MAG: hypothetical protein DHS20C01_01970 [marine bacterium B5-7]|nr:MAG: hypothetical protein DHS20C01_01970 [marine bacterium B5-7]